MSKQNAVRIPNSVLERIEASCQKMTEVRGVKPSFSAWAMEAFAEKLNREDKLKSE